MENDLDEIAEGTQESLPWLSRFYFGVPGAPANATVGQRHPTIDEEVRLGLKAAVATHLGEIDAREINSIPIATDENGETIVVRVGRYGPYSSAATSAPRSPRT